MVHSGCIFFYIRRGRNYVENARPYCYGSYFCNISRDNQKSNYDVILVKIYFGNQVFNWISKICFIGWQDINIPMKPIDYKMRTYFTIQDGKNVRNATKRIKKILDTNYKKDNLKKRVNNSKCLRNSKKFCP